MCNQLMKTTALVIFATLASVAIVQSQETDAADSKSAIVPLTNTRAIIPHSLALAEFTPPAPLVVRRVPTMRIDSALTIPTASLRTLTIIRGEASKLPNIPLPPVDQVRAARTLTPDYIARNIYRRRHSFNFGATVYDHRISQIHWHHSDTGESYEAVCGFDIGLLAGIGRFVRDGESYDFMLMSSNIDTTVYRRIASRFVPQIPEVATNSITIIKGNQNDPVGTAPITLIKELIANERIRLVTYQAARLRHQKAAAAWEKAHPVQPRDETFWFRPHRGSRYLVNPKPEAAIK